MGLLAIVSGIALILRRVWARGLALFAFGMLGYSSINSAGWPIKQSQPASADARNNSPGRTRAANVAASHNNSKVLLMNTNLNPVGIAWDAWTTQRGGSAVAMQCQRERLRTLLGYSRARSPFYAEHYRG